MEEKVLNNRSENEVRSICIGDTFLIDGCHRVIIDNSHGRIITVSGPDCLVESFDRDYFILKVKNGEYIKVDITVPAINSGVISEEEMSEMRRRAEVFEEILADAYPNWEILFKKRISHKYFHDASERLGIGDRQCRRLFDRYLLSARNLLALADMRRQCERLGSRGALLTTGHAFYNGKVTSVLNNAEVKKQLKEALSIFKKELSVKKAHRAILNKYYTVFEEDEYGNSHEKLLPEEDCLSYKRVYNFVSDNLGGLTIKEYVAGQRELRNNHRPLSGNSQTGVTTIGQLYQIDECELIGTAVSEKDPMKVLGKAVVYAAVDVRADMIVGIYVGLKNNSFTGFCDVMLSMLEDHNNQTSLVGVNCTPYEFPSLTLPKAIRADHGSEYESKAMKATCKELGIRLELVPVACGSFKGLVEKAFHQIQQRMRPSLIAKGLISKNHTAKELRLAAENACLTIKDYREIVYRTVIEINLRPREGLHPTLEQMEAGLIMSPAEVYQWEHDRFPPENVTDFNRDAYTFALLQKDRDFKVSRAGIEYMKHPLRFFSNQQWFINIVNRKSEWGKLEIRYDDRFIDRVYVRYEGKYHTVPLAEGREEQDSLKGLSWNDYDTLYDSLYPKQREAKWQAEGRMGRTEAAIDSTVGMASQIKEAAKNEAQTKETKKKRKAGIRKNRALERTELEGGSAEAKNRVLSDFGIQTEIEDALPAPVCDMDVQRPEEKPAPVSARRTDDDLEGAREERRQRLRGIVAG